ncbi:hypothetical protein MP638_001843 [Amoeboaphelidium occidentale]|nr:hypothetical protein MP638_001843 [Amoeboaphelidium occidentale]
MTYSLEPRAIEAKVVIVGNQAVGKTSIARRILDNSFTHTPNSTVGASLVVKRIVVDGCAPLFFRGATAAICVYDITSRSTFDDLDAWIKSLRSIADENCEVIYFVGNKADLSQKRQVYPEDVAHKIRMHGGNIQFSEVSALTNEGIQDLFADLARKIHSRYTRAKTPSLMEWKEEKSLSLERPSKSCCYY